MCGYGTGSHQQTRIEANIIVVQSLGFFAEKRDLRETGQGVVCFSSRSVRLPHHHSGRASLQDKDGVDGRVATHDAQIVVEIGQVQIVHGP
jgi:hypothetical protein